MASSNVAIVNMALTGIGAARILKLSDDTETARKCNAVYESIRDEVLASYPWRFALARQSLSRLADGPEYGYEYAFQIPLNCLRVISSDLDESGYPWTREGDRLVTNQDSMKILYVKRETDANKFTQGFITALAARLEAELCYPITQNGDLAKQKLEIYFKSKLPLAKSLDAQEGRDGKLFVSDAWLDARGSGQI
jgi:hypothetical protein